MEIHLIVVDIFSLAQTVDWLTDTAIPKVTVQSWLKKQTKKVEGHRKYGDFF